MRTIETLRGLRSRHALIHSDFNVPLKDGRITDDDRIRVALPTLTRLTETGAKAVIMAHLGRPKGKVGPVFSLAPVAKRLGEPIDAPVALAKDIAGRSAKATIEVLKDGEVALLENVRHDACETSRVDEEHGELVAVCAELGDAFVSDSFGVVRRKQASAYDIAKPLPFVSGLPVLEEIEPLRKATNNPEHPYGVVLGGSEISGKLGVIANLLKKTNRLFVGGGMVFTFLAIQGHSVGKSLFKEEQIDTMKGYIAEAAERGVELILPIDVVVAPEFATDAPAGAVTVDQIPIDQVGLDAGPGSREPFAEETSSAKIVTWNGPMGVFKFPASTEGTRAIAKAPSEGNMFSVIGGGDSAATVRFLGFDRSAFSYISIDDGVSLELFEDKVLPGITTLKD